MELNVGMWVLSLLTIVIIGMNVFTHRKLWRLKYLMATGWRYDPLSILPYTKDGHLVAHSINEAYRFEIQGVKRNISQLNIVPNNRIVRLKKAAKIH